MRGFSRLISFEPSNPRTLIMINNSGNTRLKSVPNVSNPTSLKLWMFVTIASNALPRPALPSLFCYSEFHLLLKYHTKIHLVSTKYMYIISYFESIFTMRIVAFSEVNYFWLSTIHIQFHHLHQLDRASRQFHFHSRWLCRLRTIKYWSHYRSEVRYLVILSLSEDHWWIRTKKGTSCHLGVFHLNIETRFPGNNEQTHRNVYKYVLQITLWIGIKEISYILFNNYKSTVCWTAW